MGRFLALLLACLTIYAATTPTAYAESPILPARAYLLMDGASGRVLHAYEGDTPLPIASTTKIMTAILALEQGNLSDVVAVGRKPYLTGGSTIWLDEGEQQSLEDLLYALMLESANDAAVAIAEHLAGTEERFVDWMNAKAQAIGATQTHFVNSHGLHEPDHYSTAHDLGLIARYALQNDRFRQVAMTEERVMPGSNPETAPRTLQSHNQLLGYYEGTTGVKNGFTEEAGLTNVASAKRGDFELIAVVLGAENRLWTSSMALLDFGFSHFVPAPIVQSEEPVASVAAFGDGLVSGEGEPSGGDGIRIGSGVLVEGVVSPVQASGLMLLLVGLAALITNGLNPTRRLLLRFRFQ